MDFKDAVIKGEGLSLPIHSLVRALQSEHGLRHRDHARYCHFLSRKLARVRKSLGLQLNFEAPGGSSGSGKRGKRPTNTESFIPAERVTCAEHLLLPLLYGVCVCVWKREREIQCSVHLCVWSQSF
jgi:hypothetical protein